MSLYSIIILSVMLLCVIVSFYVLFVAIKTDNTIIVPSYDNSIKKIRDDGYGYTKDDKQINQQDLINSVEYVLDCLD